MGLATPIRLCARSPEAQGRMCVERLRLAGVAGDTTHLFSPPPSVARQLTLCLGLGVCSSAGLRRPAALGSRLDSGLLHVPPSPGTGSRRACFPHNNPDHVWTFPTFALFVSSTIASSKASRMAKLKPTERQ